MERHSMQRRTPFWALLSLSVASTAIPAEGRGQVLGENGNVFAALSVMSDDNFFRRDVDRARESRARLAAGMSAALQLGRQDLEVSATVNDNRFENAEELNYVGGTGNVSLDWEAGSRWDGTLEHGYIRDLTSFDRLQPIQTIDQDLTTVNESRASVGYFMLPRLQLRAEAAAVDWAHSSAGWRASELEESQYGLSVMFRTRSDTFIGIGTRRHDGVYPHRVLGASSKVDRAYDQVNSAVIVEWHAGGRTSLDARVGYTSREQERFSERDFDAVTGDFSLDYAMSSKTELGLRYSRNIVSIDEAVARAALVDTLEVAPVWRASRSIALSFHAVLRREDFLSVPGLETARVDESFHLESQVYYNLKGRLDIELGVGRGDRESTWPGLDYDYWYGSVGVRVTM